MWWYLYYLTVNTVYEDILVLGHMLHGEVLVYSNRWTINFTHVSINRSQQSRKIYHPLLLMFNYSWKICSCLLFVWDLQRMVLLSVPLQRLTKLWSINLSYKDLQRFYKSCLGQTFTLLLVNTIYRTSNTTLTCNIFLS